ncbi:MAG TPA: ATP-binding protein [Thermodesulfobacteriota bacterium]|nr:ATP-binding protein [Thermodesulfobacteriota bacterium]
MLYSQKTGKISVESFTLNAEEGFLKLNLSKQITLGFALMLFLIVIISGFSVYSVYRLDQAASNIEGRYNTISSLLSREGTKTQRYVSFENEMLLESIKISDEQVKYAYITTLTLVGITLLFGGIITLMAPRVITRPVSRLVNAAKFAASGDYSYRVEDIRGDSEISTLIRAFNNMLESTERNKEELEKKNAENLRLLETTKKFNEVLEARVKEVTREIEEKQEELIKSEKLATIGELATGIAHEIRNPLSGISVALELMKSETEVEEHKETISDILKEIDRLGRIIKELLQLGRHRSLNLIECSPNEIVERALNLVYAKAKEKGIEVEKKLNCKEQFCVDYEQIQQVVINLLINGIEAIDGSGKLTVETENSDGHVKIKVADTGPGFPEEIKEKIFRPFFSQKEHGTGLGLPISSRIVESHKGRIVVSSEIGKGAMFTVVIPKNPTG